MSIRPTPARIAVAALLACGVLAASAAAVFSTSSGKAQLEMLNAGESVGAPATNSVAWLGVPNAGFPVTVPAGTSHVFNARFTAESRCFGAGAGFCRVRITATNTSTGAVFELGPQAGSEFQFDTDVPGAADVDLKEARAMERSARLPSGQYRIRVESSVSVNTTWFELDDWHLALERSAT